MDLISPEQCRAARALLDWSQPELAAKCNMHVQTISSFEKATGSPTRNTLLRIFEIFLRAGIEFLPNNGVAMSKDKFYISEGYLAILEDCLNSLQPGDEILSHCADDRRSTEEVNRKFEELHAKGIIMRATTCAANDKRRPFRAYKILPDDYFNTSQLILTYGDKIVMHLDGGKENYRFLTIKNKTLADVMSRQFEYWWKNGKPVLQQK